jgi:uncharacterized membrane protein
LNRRALYLGLLTFIACAQADDVPPAGDVTGATALAGSNFAEGQRIVQTACSPCHTKAGGDPHQRQAYADFKLDTYEQLASRALLAKNALTLHGARADMPPDYAPAQLTPAERQTLLGWLDRSLPNTPDGR